MCRLPDRLPADNSRINYGSFLIILVIIIDGLSGCTQFFSMPRDCSYVSLSAQGRVLDLVTQEPIEGARITVKSVGGGDCPWSTPIADFTMFSDQEGRFATPITIAQDNYLEISITADRCFSRTLSNAFWGTFMATRGDETGLIVYLGCE